MTLATLAADIDALSTGTEFHFISDGVTESTTWVKAEDGKSYANQVEALYALDHNTVDLDVDAFIKAGGGELVVGKSPDEVTQKDPLTEFILNFRDVIG